MTVDHLLRTTTAAELAEWMAYFQILNEPKERDVDKELHAIFGGPRRRP